MKARRRNSRSFRQSRIVSLRENIWFYSDSNSVTQLPETEQKSIKNDRLSILNDDYKRFAPEIPERKKEKKEGSFVVDWQMSDVF